MIDTEALRKKVLTLAFEGKLTEQLSSDSDVSTIIEKCRSDKEKSIHDGKYKKESFRGMVENSSKSIPSNWGWMFISDMSLFQEGPGILAVDFRKEGVPLIRISGMDGQSVSLKGCNFLDPEMVEEKWSHFKLDEGDILISTSASLDRISEVDEETEGAIPYTGLIRFKMYGGINKDYFKWYVKSPLYIEQVNNQKQGGFISHYGPTHLRKMMVPISPVEEQKRVVEVLDDIFAQIQLIDDLQAKYSNDLAVLKSKIIDAGIQGKLTEQLPEDGDAEDLYAQIKKEKEYILESRGGRIDKSIKSEDEDKPFEIPYNWKWIHFGEVGLFKKGPFGSALTKSMFIPKSKEAIKVYEQQHAIKKDASLGKYYISREYFDSNMRGFEVKSGDIIVSCAGTIGETYILPDEIEQGIINQALMRVTLVPSIDKEFFIFYFDSNLKTNAQNESNGMAIKNIPPFDVMKNWYFPLPPVAEQKRIVAKIEAIMEKLNL